MQAIATDAPADSVLSVSRLLLLGISAAAGILGLSLWIGAAQTSQFFAWTIKSPTTASALGSFYIGIATYALLASRARHWELMRIVFPPAIFAPAALLIPTAIHHSLFAFDHAVTWLWLLLYIFYPPALLLVYLRGRAQERRPFAVQDPFPFPQRIPLAFAALVLCALGLLLFVHPESLIPSWPWPLTPLVGQVYGCWLMAAGIAGMILAREADWMRARVGIQAQLVLTAALVVGPVLHPVNYHLTAPTIAWQLGFGLLMVYAGLLLWQHRVDSATPS